MDPILIPAARVLELILEVGISTLNVQLANTRYIPLDEDWVLGTFKEAWFTKLTRQGLLVPQEQKRECDHYSLWLMAYMTEMHSMTEAAPVAALGIGEMWLTLDGGLEHDRNIGLFRKNGVDSVRFLEPQPSWFGFAQQSETELNSVEFIRM